MSVYVYVCVCVCLSVCVWLCLSNPSVVSVVTEVDKRGMVWRSIFTV